MPAAQAQGEVTAGEAILALLADRTEGATICPSEAARLMAGPQGDWRAEIEAVHAATDALAEAGMLRLSWKGADTQKRRGPDRIARR